MASGLAAGSAAILLAGDEKKRDGSAKVVGVPTEAPFERDYAPSSFKPRWLKPQINRLFVQDFVTFEIGRAHV